MLPQQQNQWDISTRPGQFRLAGWMTCIYTSEQENEQEKQIISCSICWFYLKEKCVLMCYASTAAPQWKYMMGNKEKEHSRAIQGADFAASGEITATSSVQHPSEALVFTNKAGLFRQEGEIMKSPSWSTILLMGRYTAECVHSAHMTHSIIHSRCLTD